MASNKSSLAIARAFLNSSKLTLGHRYTDGQHVYYRGNMIARRNETGSVEVTMAGWCSTTTSSCVNAVLELINSPKRFGRKNWKPVFKFVNEYGDLRPQEIDSCEWYNAEELLLEGTHYHELV